MSNTKQVSHLNQKNIKVKNDEIDAMVKASEIERLRNERDADERAIFTNKNRENLTEVPIRLAIRLGLETAGENITVFDKIREKYEKKQAAEFTEDFIKNPENNKSYADYEDIYEEKLNEIQSSSKRISLLKAKEMYEKENNIITPTNETKSIKLSGGNGMGKTQMTLKEVCEYIKRQGLIPVIYDPSKEEIYRPKSDLEVLVVYQSCVNLEIQDIKGLPVTDITTVPVFKNGVVETRMVTKEIDGEEVEMEEIVTVEKKSLKYSIVPKWESIGNALRAVIILDELNRSPESHVFNALANGEPIDGVKMPALSTMIVAMQNASDTGLNMNLTEQDGAANTKIATYHVYQTVEGWLPYAIEKGIHPAVQAFAKIRPNFLEKQNMVGGIEVAFPTFRGLEQLSNELYIAEKNNEKLYGAGSKLSQKVVEALFQSRVGLHPDTGEVNSLPSLFAEFYTNGHLILTQAIEETMRVSMEDPLHVGLKDLDMSNAILKSVHGISLVSNDFDISKDKRDKEILDNNKNINSSMLSEQEMQENIHKTNSLFSSGKDADRVKNMSFTLPDYVIKNVSNFFNAPIDNIFTSAGSYILAQKIFEMDNDKITYTEYGQGLKDSGKFDDTDFKILQNVFTNFGKHKHDVATSNNNKLIRLSTQNAIEDVDDFYNHRGDYQEDGTMSIVEAVAVAYIEKAFKLALISLPQAADVDVFRHSFSNGVTIEKNNPFKNEFGKIFNSSNNILALGNKDTDNPLEFESKKLITYLTFKVTRNLSDTIQDLLIVSTEKRGNVRTKKPYENLTIEDKRNLYGIDEDDKGEYKIDFSEEKYNAFMKISAMVDGIVTGETTNSYNNSSDALKQEMESENNRNKRKSSVRK